MFLSGPIFRKNKMKLGFCKKSLWKNATMKSITLFSRKKFRSDFLQNPYFKGSTFRECVRAGAAGARTRRSLGHHLLHPLILRLLVLCAPAVLRPRALKDAPAPSDPNS